MSDETPAHAQSDVQTPPAAPERQAKPAVPASVLSGLQKLQFQTPAPEGSTAASTPVLTDGVQGSAGIAGQANAGGKKDLKTLIHQEFGKLMATKKYTPNEAAVLAVKNVSRQS